jgi:hypothetical protein
MDERTHTGAGRHGGGCEDCGDEAVYRFDAYGELVDESVDPPPGVGECSRALIPDCHAGRATSPR